MGWNFPFGGYVGGINPAPFIANASNVKGGTNPPFTLCDFYQFYPQFDGQIPQPVVEYYLAMADATVKHSRWKDWWKQGMVLFLAHFSTLYLQSMTGNNPTAGQVVAAAKTKGIQTSKSVGDVSVSYDFGDIGQDLDGWAAWKLTTFGVQYASMAKLVGKGNMYVW